MLPFLYDKNSPLAGWVLLFFGEIMRQKQYRPDRDGKHRRQFDLNRRRIYATGGVCGICGQPVDMSLDWHNPMSKCIDHIIPVSKGGHPSDIDNLQLAHRVCNANKSDKLPSDNFRKKDNSVVSNRVLPQPTDWKSF